MVWRREYSALIALMALLLYLFFTTRRFFSAGNVVDILTNNSYILIAATGATLVILAGGIDISIGSMLAACAVVAGELAKRNMPLPAVTVATIGAGALLGWINGAVVAWLDVPPIIVTLGTLSIYRGAVIWYTGGNWITGLPPSFQAIGTGAFLHVPMPVWCAALVFALGQLLLESTRTGRRFRAVGSNASTAALAGINVRRIRLLTYVFSGVSTGAAALVYTARFSQVQSNTGVGLELLVITAIVVGGTNIFGAVGSLWGTLAGVILLGAVDPALAYRHVSAYWEGAIQGSFILLGIAGDAVRSRRQG